MELKELRVHKARKVPRVKLVVRARKGTRATREPLGCRGQKENRARLASPLPKWLNSALSRPAPTTS